MTGPIERDEVVRYIRENRGTYTDDAIRKLLIGSGHTQAAVNAGFREVDRRDMQEKRDPRRWRLFLGYAIGLFGVVFALFVWGSNMGERTYGIGLGVWVISMVAGLALAIAIVRRNRAFALGLTGGALTALLVPFIIVFIIAGLCVLSTNPTFFPAPPPTAPPA
jgi:hypothetical protein